MSTPHSILIGVPTRTGLHGLMVSDLIALMQQTPYTMFAPCLGVYVQNNRTRLARAALELKATHLLFIDNDIRFPPGAASRLLAHRRSIVGVNCQQGTQKATTAFAGGRFISSERRQGLEAVTSLGFGMVLIDTEVFRVLEEPWFATPWDPVSKKHTGEDTWFCHYARQQGFESWVDHDLSQEVTHFVERAAGFGVHA